MKVIKRNGTSVPYDGQKIINAITKANEEMDFKFRITEQQIKNIKESIEEKYADNSAVTVEDIQDTIEESLVNLNKYQLAKAYITYRYIHALKRGQNSFDSKILSIIEYDNEEVKQENSNKNPQIVSVQRDYMAGEVSKEITNKFFLPPDVVEANKQGIIHVHDTDYFAQKIHNCDLINLEDMLQNGTVISETMIEKPHTFSTACNIATQAIAQIASSQFGGQSFSLAHLVPFVNETRRRSIESIRKNFEKIGIPATEEQIKALAEEEVKKDINRGIQIIQYQIVTLMTTNGQAPFVTMFVHINEVEESMRKDFVMCAEEVFKQRLKGVKNEKGVWVTPAFPKIIYVLDENNVTEDTPYWDLTVLAAKCTAKRMVPDIISAKKMRELKEGNVYPCMGCRSFLTVYHDENGKPKFYGRFNAGVVTINLVDIACSSEKDEKKFWEIFDARLELCHKALNCRLDRLKGTPSDFAPILWQHGALARLKKGETIDKLLQNNYCTISLGYAGLYECTKYMTGKSHTDDNGGKEFALRVMRHLNDACAKWRAESGVGFSLYGTPLESTTYTFAKKLQKRFGKIPGITDRGYITNSYHVNVREKINAFDKLTFESEFQELSPGGAVSYVEVPNLQNNIPAVLELYKHIYNHILYAELNTKSDYCQECGFDGEMSIVEDEDGKLIWKCPNCGNTNQDKMNVARRTCGYIGTQFWNQGRTQEIRDRVLHL